MDLSNENIIHIKKDNIEFLQFKDLLKYPNITHAFSLKPLDFKSRQENELKDNYKKLLECLDLEFKTLVKPKQNHTDNILVLDKKQNEDTADINLDYIQNIDGIITNKKDITLATTSADCICMIMFDPEKEVIANIHSGWRGTFKKISQKAVLMMQKTYNCNPKNIKVYIAPSIRKCHFCVDVDVMEECKNIFEYTNKLDKIIEKGQIVDGKQKYNIDTILINKYILNEVGILNENIIDSGICSYCNGGKIHSRRIEGEDYGLGTTVVCVK